MVPPSGSGLSDVGTRSLTLILPYTMPTRPTGRSRARAVISTPAAPTVAGVLTASSPKAARSPVPGCAGFQKPAAPPVASADGWASVVAATRHSSAPAPS